MTFSVAHAECDGAEPVPRTRSRTIDDIDKRLRGRSTPPARSIPRRAGRGMPRATQFFLSRMPSRNVSLRINDIDGDGCRAGHGLRRPSGAPVEIELTRRQQPHAPRTPTRCRASITADSNRRIPCRHGSGILAAGRDRGAGVHVSVIEHGQGRPPTIPGPVNVTDVFLRCAVGCRPGEGPGQRHARWRRRR